MSCDICDSFHLIPISLSCQVFTTDTLTRPHMVVGNGQHLTCAALVIAAALGTIQFHAEVEDVAIPPPLSSPEHLQIVPVSADGRCFFSSLYVFLACSAQERREWWQTIRNDTGFPIDSSRLETEEREFLQRSKQRSQVLASLIVFQVVPCHFTWSHILPTKFQTYVICAECSKSCAHQPGQSSSKLVFGFDDQDR